MRKNIKISKIDKKRNKILKKKIFLLKKNGNCFICFGQMSQNDV